MALTEYELADGVATIAMDDGKVNALSVAMLGEVSAGFDRAEEDEAEVVVLTGAAIDVLGRLRPADRGRGLAGDARRRRSPGRADDVLPAAGPRRLQRQRARDGRLPAALGRLPRRRDAGDFKIGLNEVRIGLTMPWFGIEIARHRLTRPYFDRCTVTGRRAGTRGGAGRRIPRRARRPRGARGGRAARRRGAQGRSSRTRTRRPSCGSARTRSPAFATGSTGSRSTTASGERPGC